jgi:SAM-dependent methyltransferase
MQNKGSRGKHTVKSPFDQFAWFYDQHWGAPFEQWQRRALEQLLYPCVKAGGRILDLCCGTGTLARHMADLGYRISGVDSSDGMLQLAREKVPAANFVHADARDFKLQEQADGAVSVFDSLNHLLEPDQLQRVFHQVYAALNPGAYFVFDTNTAAAYGDRWDQTFCEVQPGHAFFLRGGFDRNTRIGRTQITMFRLTDAAWERADVEMRQRPWEISELEPMLGAAGFKEIRGYRASEDLGMSGHYAIGRAYLRARKPSED